MGVAEERVGERERCNGEEGKREQKHNYLGSGAIFENSRVILTPVITIQSTSWTSRPDRGSLYAVNQQDAENYIARRGRQTTKPYSYFSI